MSFTAFFRRPLLFAVILLLLPGIFMLPTQPAAAASGTVWPPQGETGTRFTYTATGFQPGERIDAWVTDPNGVSSTRYPSFEADAEGAAVWTWDAPPNAPLGWWTMAARGIRSNQRVSIPFEIVAATTSQPLQGVEPQSGGPGTTFTFYAAGFREDERVGTWLNAPDGTNIDLIPGDVPWIQVGDTGRISWSWTVPENAQSGTWRAMARGLASGREVMIPFDVTAPPVTTPASSVTPPAGPVGTTFTFSAGGFVPNEQVGTWLNAPDGSRVDATPWIFADESGAVTWSWTVPDDVIGGNWQAVARGFDSRYQVLIGFEITGPTSGPAPLPPQNTTVEPPSGPPGTTFNFSADGFEPGEDVYFWPVDPMGQPERNRAPAEADANGRATWSWTARERQVPTGTWQMAARGGNSRREVQIAFQIVPPEDTGPFLTVDPPNGAPGTVFTFRGRTFNVKEYVNIWLVNPAGRVVSYAEDYGTVKADKDGRATWRWQAPENALGGVWELYAEGDDSDLLFSVRFTIYNETPPPPESTGAVTPGAGPPGTTFTFTATGYTDGEMVGYWIDRPDGSRITFDDVGLIADAEGRVTWTWTAPEDAPRGQYLMVAQSALEDAVNNNVTVAIPFRIE